MGPIKSNEMLLFSKRITADEALKAGLVTEVFPVSTFDSTVWPKIKQLSELPPQVCDKDFLFILFLEVIWIHFNLFFGSL